MNEIPNNALEHIVGCNVFIRLSTNESVEGKLISVMNNQLVVDIGEGGDFEDFPIFNWKHVVSVQQVPK